MKPWLKAIVPEACKRRYRAFHWRYAQLRWLPGTSRQFGPPRRWVRLADYLAQHPGTMREVLPAHTLPPAKFSITGPVPDRYFSRLQTDIPPAFVAEIPDVRLLGAEGWVVGAGDSLILDTSYHAYHDREMSRDGHWILARKAALPLRRLRGRTLSLASDFAAGGFAHFVHDSLCRLHLLERAGINPADFDHIYWPHPPFPGAVALVAAAGLPPDRLIGANPQHDLACDSLTVTTFPGRPAHISPPYCEFLRRRFVPPPLGAGRRIFLSRSGFARRIVNEPEVNAVLARHGYEFCQPHQDPEVFAKCAAATHLVSLEGSGFTNAFAAPPGTHSLIILPEAGQTLPYNQVLALSAGHRVHLLGAESVPVPGRDPSAADVRIDPALLTQALAGMEAA
jgi:capsular polysaccharide biosynthesis protein